MPGLILVLIGIIAWVATVGCCTTWIMRPLDRAGKRYWGRATFTTIDFFGLVFVVQIPLALVRVCYPGDFRANVVLNTIGIGTALAIWLVGVIMLGRARVRNNPLRLLFTTFILPFTVYGSLLFATTLVWGIGLLLSQRQAFAPSEIAMGVGLASGTFAGLLFCGWTTRRMVAGAQRRVEAHGDADAGEVDGSIDEYSSKE